MSNSRLPMSNNYPTTFRTYILGAVRYALAQVQATPNLLSDTVRQQALHALSYALDLPEAWPVTRDLLLAMAPKMEQAGHREDWMPYLARGIASGESQGDLGAVAECQLQLGLLYRLVSDFAQALAWVRRSQANFAQVADAVGQARALNERAWVDYLQYHYAAATAVLQHALTLLPASHPEQGMSYRVLGMIAIDQEKWKEAEQLHRKALEHFKQQDDQRHVAWGLQNLAYALRGQNNFDEALEHYQQAAETLDAIQDKHNWAIVQMNVGLVYFHARQPVHAVAFLAKAEEVMYQLGDTLQMARVYTNQGLVYYALQNYSQAEKAFQSAVQLYGKLSDRNRRLNALDGLAMTYLAQQQFTLASEILEAALLELSSIAEAPNHVYLLNAMNQHLQQAREGKAKQSFSKGFASVNGSNGSN